MTTVYRILFNNTEGAQVRIDITDTTTSGDNEYTYLTGTGFSRRSVTNEDPFSPIRAIEADIKFISTETVNASTFFEGDENRWHVEASVDGTILLSGFLVTDDIKEPYFDPPNEVTLTMNDGLGALKGYTLQDAGVNPRGHYRVAEIVSLCLNAGGVILPFWVMWNLRVDGGSDHWMDEIYQHSKSYEDEINVSEDCYSVLEKILGM